MKMLVCYECIKLIFFKKKKKKSTKFKIDADWNAVSFEHYLNRYNETELHNPIILLFVITDSKAVY